MRPGSTASASGSPTRHLLGQAREAAWNHAIAKADQLATLSGHTLGKATTITEVVQGPVVPMPRIMAADGDVGEGIDSHPAGHVVGDGDASSGVRLPGVTPPTGNTRRLPILETGNRRAQLNDHSRRIYDSMLGLLSNAENPTPLVRLNHVVPLQHTEVYAKLEWYNLFGSVKDRIVEHDPGGTGAGRADRRRPGRANLGQHWSRPDHDGQPSAST